MLIYIYAHLSRYGDINVGSFLLQLTYSIEGTQYKIEKTDLRETTHGSVSKKELSFHVCSIGPDGWIVGDIRDQI